MFYIVFFEFLRLFWFMGDVVFMCSEGLEVCRG